MNRLNFLASKGSPFRVDGGGGGLKPVSLCNNPRPRFFFAEMIKDEYATARPSSETLEQQKSNSCTQLCPTKYRAPMHQNRHIIIEDPREDWIYVQLDRLIK